MLQPHTRFPPSPPLLPLPPQSGSSWSEVLEVEAHASDSGEQGLSENAFDFDLYEPPDPIAEQQYYRGVAESDFGADFSELDHQLNLLSAGSLEAPPQPGAASLESCAAQLASASLQFRVLDELIVRFGSPGNAGP